MIDEAGETIIASYNTRIIMIKDLPMGRSFIIICYIINLLYLADIVLQPRRTARHPHLR